MFMSFVTDAPSTNADSDSFLPPADFVAMAISRDGQYLAAATDMPQCRVHLWDLHTGRLLASSQEDCDYLVDDIQFCPADAQLFYTVARDKYDMSVWEVLPAYQKRLLKQKCVLYLNPSLGV